ncbi:enhancer of variegation 3-9 [Haematobia irritans]|uniref:enhancer of variegation 3-9 n=1 Tax=Haematobia irritans TaxID=7368 RepID=UPI003F509AF4
MTTIDMDQVEACRTCGVYYMSTTNYMKPLFQNAVENPDMMLIRLELAQWKIDISEHDGLPQHLCCSCFHEFQKIFKFRASCTETQNQLRSFYNFREYNLANINIKTEIIEPTEKESAECHFIYVDDLSDEENDTATPFNIPHVPIKEELIIEEATIPRDSDNEKMVESASEQVNKKSPVTDDSNQPTEQAPPPVECQLCQHLSPNQEEHKQHLQRVHEIRDMECHICGKTFKNSTPSRFKFHLKWHNINKHVKCTQCGFVCSSRQSLKEHKRAVHTKINCKICGKCVIAKKMKSHLRQHQILSQFPCEYCTDVFQSNEDRENHIWQVHGNVDNEEPTCTTNESLSEIHDNHNASNELVHVTILCAHCDEKFAKQSDLQDHVREVHRSQQQTKELPNDCTGNQDACSGSKEHMNENKNSNSLTVFEDYDSPSAPDNAVMQKNDLESMTHFQDSEIHMSYSTNETNNSQNDIDDDNVDQDQSYEGRLEEQSNSITVTLSDNEQQLETNDAHIDFGHDGRVYMPFACAKCPDKFATVEELQTHFQQHKEQVAKSPTKSSFKCDLCGKKFDLKFSLNRHMKKHNKAS